MTEFFIKRPAFTIVVTLVMTILGLLSFRHLPIRWVPNIAPPVVSIYAAYPGANANLVENELTTLIEGALSSVSGIETISSNSKQGACYININFKKDYNLNAAVEDVRSALQRITDSLPQGVKPPSVEKADPNGNPIMYIAFYDDNRSAKDVTDYVKQYVIPHLQTLEGMATVQTYGTQDMVIKLALDPMKMAAANVSIEDITTALNEQNVQTPSGQIKGSTRIYSVTTNELFNSVEEFNNLIIRDNKNHVIHFKDIGQAYIDANSTESSFRVGGKAALAIGIIPQSNANPLSVTHAVKNEFQQIIRSLPNGMHAEIAFNQADYIESSINHVYHSLFEAILFVLVVILLFLASFRAALIPIVTVPVCLISVFSVIVLFGFSINTITLMALVLAIGLVVDDAIVMLENVSRHIEEGKKPFLATKVGSKEVIFPIIAMTLTLVAVYAPLFFMSGLLNSLFKEFAVTLAGTVLISGVVALTLSPMMCARLLNPFQPPKDGVPKDCVKDEENFVKQQKSYGEYLHGWMQTFQDGYASLLRSMLHHKKSIFLGLALIGAVGLWVGHSLPSELAPDEDRDEIEVYLSAPRDASFQYTDQYSKKLEAMYLSVPEIKSYLSEVGTWSISKGYHYITLTPKDKRKLSTEKLIQLLNDKVKPLVGVDISFSMPSSPLSWYSNNNGSSVAMQVISTEKYENIHEAMKNFIEQAQKSPVFQRVDSKLKWDGEQFEISINREKAADVGVTISNITGLLSTLLAGKAVGHFIYNGQHHDVMMQLNSNRYQLSDANMLYHLYVRSNNNKMVPLSDMITIKESASPEMLPHYERLRADTLFGTIASGYTMGTAVKTLQEIAKQTLPDQMKYAFVGSAKDYLESNYNMLFTFLLAMIFIYLILVAQFENFIDPLSILITVPFAVVGAVLTLKLFGGTLNVYSSIGLVTLIGLIAKHGILITEFANRQRAQGKEIFEAVIEAAKLRLRPILMTTSAMVLGAIPLALASGPGAESRHQIGWVIVGGLIFGTFFSLIVVPMMYTVFSQFRPNKAVADE